VIRRSYIPKKIKRGVECGSVFFFFFSMKLFLSLLNPRSSPSSIPTLEDRLIHTSSDVREKFQVDAGFLTNSVHLEILLHNSSLLRHFIPSLGDPPDSYTLGHSRRITGRCMFLNPFSASRDSFSKRRHLLRHSIILSRIFRLCVLDLGNNGGCCYILRKYSYVRRFRALFGCPHIAITKHHALTFVCLCGVGVFRDQEGYLVSIWGHLL
jgi:hypothetical protein